MKKGYAKSKKSNMVRGYDMPDMSPSLHLEEKDLPELKGWKVGNKYKINLEVEQTGSQIDEYDGQRKQRATFKILKAEGGK